MREPKGKRKRQAYIGWTMAGSSSRWSEVVLALGSNLVGIHRVTGRGQGRHTLGAQSLPWGSPALR